MTTVFQCEIDKHARSVLDYHWPDVPKWDDVSTLTGAHILEVTGGVDVVAWGSPCQDLSLAGKRAGLSGERSGLFHQGIRIIKELRELSNGKYPTWSIWENVVGALSSNGGADFGEVLYEMDEAGACFSEWTVLDAQYFGVPQRRRRVFVTSCFDFATSERCGSPLFPVCKSVPRDSTEGGKKKQDASRKVDGRIETSGELVLSGEIANTITASLYHHGTVVNQDADAGHLVVEIAVAQEPIGFSHTQGLSAQPSEHHFPTLRSNGGGMAVAQESVVGPLAARDYKGVGNQYVEENKLVIHESTQAISYDGYNQKLWEEQHVPLRTQGDASDFVADLREPTLIVRRLTPLECERLMGWPDNHTAQGTNGAVSDTNRYKMCGNGIASPVAQWLAKHILATRPDAN
jgi:DNA (cytosine-5)-methyltransferase 1